MSCSRVSPNNKDDDGEIIMTYQDDMSYWCSFTVQWFRWRSPELERPATGSWRQYFGPNPYDYSVRMTCNQETVCIVFARRRAPETRSDSRDLAGGHASPRSRLVNFKMANRIVIHFQPLHMTADCHSTHPWVD